MTYFDDDDSPARVLWGDWLDSYLEGQEGIESLRSRIQPNPPWPEADNPMLGYLLARAMEILEEDGPETAMTWLAVHAWFESPSTREPSSSATSVRSRHRSACSTVGTEPAFGDTFSRPLRDRRTLTL